MAVGGHLRSYRRSHKNVIVNPLPGGLAGTGADLVAAINQSTQAESEGRDTEVPREEAEEPVYAEIKPRGEKVAEEEEVEVDELAETNSGNKKEIEYWQITAKEVVKFRPCTETFIQRE